jgi:hypothetical protein
LSHDLIDHHLGDEADTHNVDPGRRSKPIDQMSLAEMDEEIVMLREKLQITHEDVSQGAGRGGLEGNCWLMITITSSEREGRVEHGGLLSREESLTVLRYDAGN